MSQSVKMHSLLTASTEAKDDEYFGYDEIIFLDVYCFLALIHVSVLRYETFSQLPILMD